MIPDSELTVEQRRRYARNISVSEIGEEGQMRLLRSGVFILGCGALGSVVASYLAGAGVGRIVLADFDTIDISNLQRQIQYGESQAGQSKAAVLAHRLSEINSSVKVETVERLITPRLANDLFADCDFIIDASDNPDTKLMVDSVCAELHKPYSIAGVLGLNGQVMTHIVGSARYSDFFSPTSADGFTPCSIGGIVGPVAGMIASVQALEAIKYLTGAGTLLINRLLVFNGLSTRFIDLPLAAR